MDLQRERGLIILLMNVWRKALTWLHFIIDVVVRFRICQIGNIEKAFHQIMICPNDHDMLRLLWVDDVNFKEPQVAQYWFCRLVIGLAH